MTTNTPRSLDAVTKRQAMDEALETARKGMFRESLETTNSGDDFFETSVWGNRQGLGQEAHTAQHARDYRQSQAQGDHEGQARRERDTGQ